MKKDENQFTPTTALAAVNAIQASFKGLHKEAEEFSPGFAAYFWRHTQAGREAIMGELMAALTAAG